jgi:ABC-type Zn uptake system ZnuABC Zn-binding protein ZnuA
MGNCQSINRELNKLEAKLRNRLERTPESQFVVLLNGPCFSAWLKDYITGQTTDELHVDPNQVTTIQHARSLFC